MTCDSTPNYKIIFIGDGETDYLFIEKMFQEDPALSHLPITILRPEETELKRRTGGGHTTLLKEAGLAAIRAAQGFADGVFVLVDNDGDPRFQFPHQQPCGAYRECEAYTTLSKINWGQPFKKDASILFQALETLLLSVRNDFTPQLEENLYQGTLKAALYGKNFQTMTEMFAAFTKILEQIQVTQIRARSYSRLKQKIKAMVEATASSNRHWTNEMNSR